MTSTETSSQAKNSEKTAFCNNNSVKKNNHPSVSIHRKKHTGNFRTVANSDIEDMALQSKKPMVQFIFMMSWNPIEVISPARLVERNIEIGGKMSEKQSYNIFSWLEKNGRLRRIRGRKKGRLLRARYELWETPYGWENIDTSCKNMQVDKISATPTESTIDKDKSTCKKMQVALIKERASHYSKRQKDQGKWHADFETLKGKIPARSRHSISNATINQSLFKHGLKYMLWLTEYSISEHKNFVTFFCRGIHDRYHKYDQEQVRAGEGVEIKRKEAGIGADMEVHKILSSIMPMSIGNDNHGAHHSQSAPQKPTVVTKEKQDLAIQYGFEPIPKNLQTAETIAVGASAKSAADTIEEKIKSLSPEDIQSAFLYLKRNVTIEKSARFNLLGPEKTVNLMSNRYKMAKYFKQ